MEQSRGLLALVLVSACGGGGDTRSPGFTEIMIGGRGDDVASDVAETADGDFVVAGRTVKDSYDAYVAKIARDGRILWETTIGGSPGEVDAAEGIRATARGGAIVVGTTTALGRSSLLLLELDAAGEEVWRRTLDAGGVATGNDLVAFSDGYVAVGTAADAPFMPPRAYIVATDLAGHPRWEHQLAGKGRSVAYAVARAADGGTVICGATYPLEPGDLGGDVLLVKIAAAGEIVWEKTLPGVSLDIGFALRGTDDGGYVIAGQTWSTGAGAGDAMLVKVDGGGEVMWTKTFGGARPDSAHAVAVLPDGGFAVAGSLGSGGGTDLFVVRTRPDGSAVWEELRGDDGFDWANAIITTSDGDLVLTGKIGLGGDQGDDIFLLRLDPDDP